jgi:hypothetical protein
MDAIDARALQAVVLLYRQYMLTERLIETRDKVLEKFELAVQTKRQSLNHVLDAYNYVFSLIDHLARFHKIAFIIPRINHKSAEFRKLDDAIGVFKDIRDQLQHIQNDLDNNYSGPLLGGICWINGTRQFMACFNDVGRQRSIPGIILSIKKGGFLHRFCYIYNNEYYDLDKAVDGMREFTDYIKSIAKIEVNNKPYEPKDDYIALCLDIRPVPDKTEP